MTCSSHITSSVKKKAIATIAIANVERRIIIDAQLIADEPTIVLDGLQL